MGFFDTLINVYKRLSDARGERMAKQIGKRSNRGKTFIHDDFFGKLEYKKADEYMGDSYLADYYEPQFKKQTSVLIESETPVIATEQREFYKLIVSRFDEMELKMFEKLSHKQSISLEEFRTKLKFFQISIYKSEPNNRKWFVSYGTESFNLHYVGFSFEEFEVVEIVRITNDGKEI